jgi:hypothetical protein
LGSGRGFNGDHENHDNSGGECRNGLRQGVGWG